MSRQLLQPGAYFLLILRPAPVNLGLLMIKKPDKAKSNRGKAPDTLHRVASLLLETLPPFMSFVSSYLRRHAPIEDHVHFRTLRSLRADSRSLHELADHHQVRTPTMSRTIDVLESRGWVGRRRSSEDRRQVFVEITSEGEEVLSTVEGLAEDRTMSLLSCLEPARLEELERGLESLRELIQERLDETTASDPANASGCGETDTEKGGQNR